jgi:WD40 repeat protein
VERGWVAAVAFSPDGKRVASGAGVVVAIRDLAAETDAVPTVGHRDIIWSAALAPGRSIAATSDMRTVRIWDTATGKELRRCGRHPGWGSCLAFSPDGTTLAAGAWDRSIGLWNPDTGEELNHLMGHSSAPWALSWTADGKKLASVALDGTARVWDPNAGKELLCIKGGFMEFRTVAFSPDGSLLATGGHQEQAALWDAKTGRCVRKFGKDLRLILSIAFSPDGKHVACGCSRNDFVRSDRDLYTGFWCSLKEPTVSIFETATCDLVREFGADMGGCEHVAFSPDSRLLAAAGQDGKVWFFEAATGKERFRLAGHRGPVTALDFASDGRTLLSASADSTALLWNLTESAADGQLSKEKLTDNALKECWTDLAADSGIKAQGALWKLVADPDRAVPYLAEHMQPAAGVDQREVTRLIAALNDDEFEVRQRATRKLVEFGDDAEVALRNALAERPALETKNRIEQILSGIGGARLPADRLRELRAVEALEHAATAEARKLLEKLALGAPEARLTREARAALKARR